MKSFTPKNTNIYKKRFFVEAVEKAAREQGITTSWSFGEWICRLQKGDVHHFIYGFNFPLNPATVWEVARDKAGVSKMLLDAGIPSSTHELFMAPELTNYIPKDGSLETIFDLAHTWKYPIICKDNRGAGGNNVYKVSSDIELKDALNKVWSVARGAALSPFYEIENEYRCFVLDGKIELAYKKIVSSDGWKFNLSKGGTVEMINIDDFPHIKQIVDASVNELNLKVCSVDIVKLKKTDQYMVLEVNTGIATEHFSKNSPEAKILAETLYSKIIHKMFE